MLLFHFRIEKMIKTLKYIIRKIPKIIRGLIITICIVPVLVYVVVQFSTNKPIEISFQNILYLFVIIILLSIIGYIIGSLRSVNYLLTQNQLTNSKDIIKNEKKSKKILPHKIITIGTYKAKDLFSDIRAEIILNEKLRPSIDVFLDRIRKGEPYCPKCSRPMDRWNASYMADFAQIGYKCNNCNIQHKGDYTDVLNDIKGKVRSDYDNYWNNYKKQIDELTEGKPEEHEIP